MKSTGTRDIRQARLFRDAIALEWTRLRNLLKPQGGSSVDQIIDELRRVSVYAKEAPASFGASIQACPSLLKMRDLYLLQYSEKRKLTTLSKTNKAVEVLLTHLKKKDVQLRDINRTIVTGWLDKLKTERAPKPSRTISVHWRRYGIWHAIAITMRHRITLGVVMHSKQKAARSAMKSSHRESWQRSIPCLMTR